MIVGDCSYIIERVSLREHDGIWDCQVSPNQPESEPLSSKPIRLTVLVPPERPQIKREVCFYSTYN